MNVLTAGIGLRRSTLAFAAFAAVAFLLPVNTLTGASVCTTPISQFTPAARDDYDVFPSAAQMIDVLRNDSNPTGGPLTVVSVGVPVGGTVSISPGGTSVVFTPAPQQTIGQFTYTIQNELSNTATATVYLLNRPTASITKTCNGNLSCIFSATTNPPLGVNTYDWNFGDGTPTVTGWRGVTIVHQFTVASLPGQRPCTTQNPCNVTVAANYGQGLTANGSLLFVPGTLPVPAIDWEGTPGTLAFAVRVISTNIEPGNSSTLQNELWFDWGDGSPQQRAATSACGPDNCFETATTLHTYTVSGRRTVTLIVKQAVNSPSPTITTFAKVFDVQNAPPVARLRYNIGSGGPQHIALTAEDSSDDLAIDRLEYDSGDGFHTVLPVTNQTLLPTLNHDYLPGSYVASVKVWDTLGLSAVATVDVKVPNQAPKAAFSINCTPDKRCLFDASDSSDDLGVVRYDWTVNGASYPDAESQLSVPFAADGAYAVTLRVGDGELSSTPVNRMAMVNTAIASSPLSYYAVAPCRVVDTRATTPLTSGVPVSIPFVGRCNIPDFASAVIVNIGVIGATSEGHIRTWLGNTVPNAAAMNFPGQTVISDNATLLLDRSGAARLAAYMTRSSDTVNVMIDVMGFYGPKWTQKTPLPAGIRGPAFFVPFAAPAIVSATDDALSPYFVLDRFTGTGYHALANQTVVAVPINVSPRCLPVAGCDNAPLLAVALNLAVDRPGFDGHVTVTPSDIANTGTTANLNFHAGRVRTNALVMPIGKGAGNLSLMMIGGGGVPADWKLEATGIFEPNPSADIATEFYPVAPCRLVDTRNPAYGAPRVTGPRLATMAANTIRVAGNCGVPVGARAVVLHTTVVAPRVSSPPPLHNANLILGPGPRKWTGGFGLAFLSAETVGTGSITPITPAPRADDLSLMLTSFGDIDADSTDVIVDVFGYFAPKAQ